MKDGIQGSETEEQRRPLKEEAGGGPTSSSRLCHSQGLGLGPRVL